MKQLTQESIDQIKKFHKDADNLSKLTEAQYFEKENITHFSPDFEQGRAAAYKYVLYLMGEMEPFNS